MRLVDIVLLNNWELPHGPKALKGSVWKALRVYNNQYDPYPIDLDKGSVFGYLVFFNSLILFIPVEDADEC